MLSHALLSLVTAGSVGGAAAYLGSLMITQRMALVGDALGHLALPGMGVAILLRLDPSLGAFAFLALGIVLTWRLAERTILSTETLVGILFVTSLALGFLIVPKPELLESLIGDIARLTLGGAAAAIALSLATALLVRRIYDGLMLLSISGDLAAVEGVRSRRYTLLFLAAVAVIVSIGIKVTGSLLVGALVIVPPAAARILSRNLATYASASACIGAASGLLGVALSMVTRFPAGPAIILVSSAAFVGALLSAYLRSRKEASP